MCSICLDSSYLGSKKALLQLPGCPHKAHYACLVQWFDHCREDGRVESCPTCRKALEFDYILRIVHLDSDKAMLLSNFQYVVSEKGRCGTWAPFSSKNLLMTIRGFFGEHEAICLQSYSPLRDHYLRQTLTNTSAPLLELELQLYTTRVENMTDRTFGQFVSRLRESNSSFTTHNDVVVNAASFFEYQYALVKYVPQNGE